MSWSIHLEQTILESNINLGQIIIISGDRGWTTSTSCLATKHDLIQLLIEKIEIRFRTAIKPLRSTSSTLWSWVKDGPLGRIIEQGNRLYAFCDRCCTKNPFSKARLHLVAQKHDYLHSIATGLLFR